MRFFKARSSSNRNPLADLRPNSGAPASEAPTQWVLHAQSPLPWVNSVTLWPLSEKASDRGA